MSDQTTTNPAGPQSPMPPDGPQAPQSPQGPQSPQSPQGPQSPQPPQSPQSPSAAAAPEACPNCGAPAEPGQLACLNCGARLQLRYRKPPSWRLPAAIVAGVLLLVVIGGGFALREITSDAEIESSKGSAPTAEEQAADDAPAAGAATGADEATPVSPGDSQPPEANPSTPPASKPSSPPRPTTIQEWPAGATGWTAVLVSHENHAGAEKRARDAIKQGIPAGVLQSGDFSSLKPGFWVVFAGRTPSKAKGEQLAKGYAAKGFPGAYARFVKK